MSHFCRLVWLFALASMAGFLLESGESLFSLGYVQNRQGMLYGPFTPVYGAGAVVLALLWPAFKGLPHTFSFVCAALVGAMVEYLWSWGQEALFGVLFWDYRHFRFHLEGRINLPFTLLWGALGLAFWGWFYPRFRSFWTTLSPLGTAVVGLALALLLAGDGMWSAAALARQDQRQADLPALSPLTSYLDEVWSDEALATRFPTMRIIEKGQTDRLRLPF